jgi:hypothetical protein
VNIIVDKWEFKLDRMHPDTNLGKVRIKMGASFVKIKFKKNTRRGITRMAETNLEAILENYQTQNTWQTLNTLNIYLERGAEDLTLSQYRRVRHLIDEIYNPNMNAFSRGVETEQQRDFTVIRNHVNKLFNDYVTDQHYRLMDEKGIRHKERVDSTLSLNPRENQYKL